MGFDWKRGLAAVGTGGLSEAYNLVKPGDAPASPDFMGVAQQQQQYNRPNQQTTFGSSEWTEEAVDIGPPPKVTGNPQKDAANAMAYAQKKAAAGTTQKQNTSLDPRLEAAAGGLMGQAEGNYSAPMDWNQFGKLDDGSQARDQAINAAYGQATKRLDPQWAKAEEGNRTQMINMGLDPNSEAARSQAQDMSFAKNDAYGGAMNSAILQGNQAGNDAYRNSMMGRQQAISEALTQRGQPMSELQGFLPFMQMPGVQQDNSMLQAAGMQSDYDMRQWEGQNQFKSDVIGGGLGIATAAAGRKR